MKTTFFILFFSIFALASYGQKTAADDVVNVYYFHGKQRCKTCIAVGKVAEQTVKELANPKVRFIEVQTDDKANAALVEKYQVTWNALIISRGAQSADITKQAFANAVNNPQVLSALVKTEVAKKL